MTEKKSGFTRYEEVDADYLENRKLKKSAGWILLWALGVGAVISGNFGGWNLGLKFGGFLGLAIGTILMAIMYVCMVFTIAELSAALPHAGGFFSFTRNAFGPTGGFICGLTDTIEYVITPAVIMFFIGEYMNVLFPAVHVYVWWILFYGVFVGINIAGVQLTLRLGLVVTLIAMAVLVVFYVSVITMGKFDSTLLWNIDPDAGQSRWLPHGFTGILAALPYAIWFYLAIEQLPLAAEEAHSAVKDMPKALIWGIVTLVLLSLFTLILNTGVGGGADKIRTSGAPLADGFEAVFSTQQHDDRAGVAATNNKTQLAKWMLILVSLAGLIASFHTIIYAYGRVLFALSRAGYFPRAISLTGKNQTPYVALILGAVVGLVCVSIIHVMEAEKSDVGAALLSMAVFGAVISYIMVMLSYIKLRISRPGLPRPYRSPLGIPGAAIGGLLALLALVSTFLIDELRPAVIGTAIFLFLGVMYFLLFSRHHLVAQAPEEEQALIAEAENELAH